MGKRNPPSSAYHRAGLYRNPEERNIRMPEIRPRTPIEVKRRLNNGGGVLIHQGRSHIQIGPDEIDALILDLQRLRQR